jgi:HAD superfamily hydrolase (TIGR01509 family)
VDLLASKAIDLRPGVERLIHEIRETGLRLAIATTTTPANVTALLNSTLGTESVQWFDCIAAGDVVAAKKPAGDIFLYCLQQLGLSASDCLAVEDSGNGVKAAVAAGLTTIVTTSSYTGQEDFSGAISVFDTLGDDVCPCQTLAGIKIDNTMVTVNDLKDLHEKNHR